jgi:predicted DNA-binding transcriptional regulator AlpA
MMMVLNIKATATRLGVSQRSVINYINKNNLFPNAYKLNPHAKRRSEWRIPLADIEAFERLRGARKSGQS